jgi:amino acid adenylation domain-containing protein
MNLVSLFEESASRWPNRDAVRCAGVATTYADLARKAAAMRAALIRHGVRVGDAVPISGPESTELLVAILGVMGAGAFYLPIDVDTPSARLAELLSDHQASVGVGWGDGAETLSGAVPRVLVPGEQPAGDSEDLINGAARDARLAYAIFTSGSTGAPKAVAIKHAAVASLMRDTRALFDMAPTDVWSLCHSSAFDFSVWEMWGALAVGGTIAIVPAAIKRDPRALADLLMAEGVTVLNQTPGALLNLITHADLGGLPLRHVILGGDAVRPGLVEAWYATGPADVPLSNMYGITEVTVHATHHTVRPSDDWPPLGIIGHALRGTEIQLVDDRLSPVEPGEAGEIMVSGARLAEGYLGDAERTAHHFPPNARADGERWYRSGDIARARADGTLEFLGRRDSQVKVRGYRVELADAERALMRSGMVAMAYVDVNEGTGAASGLRAFVVPKASVPFDRDALMDAVRRSLPPYMVPGQIVAVDELPLTANGKLDPARLASLDRAPAPVAEIVSNGRATHLDELTVAEAIVRSWALVLEVEEIGLDDDFFEIGGHSLIAAEAGALIEEALGIEMPLGLLFEHSTVAELASALREHARGEHG